MRPQKGVFFLASRRRLVQPEPPVGHGARAGKRNDGVGGVGGEQPLPLRTALADVLAGDLVGGGCVRQQPGQGGGGGHLLLVSWLSVVCVCVCR